MPWPLQWAGEIQSCSALRMEVQGFRDPLQIYKGSGMVLEKTANMFSGPTSYRQFCSCLTNVKIWWDAEP